MSAQIRPASAGRAYEAPSQLTETGSRTWITRGANFVVATSAVEPGAVLSRSDNPDEYMLLLGGIAATTMIAQIEDPEALDEIDAIATVDGIDALFIGRGDLAVALGAKSSDAPEVRSAVERIGKAARAAGKPVCVFVGGQAEASWLRDQGATAFVVASDQSFMRKAAAQALAELRSLCAPASGAQANTAQANGAQANIA